MARNFAAPPSTDSLVNTSITAAASTGTIAFWLKPNFNSGNSVDYFLGGWHTSPPSDPNPRIQIERFSDNKIYAGPFKMDNATDSRVVVADTGLFVSGTWAHHCITWDQPNNIVAYYVNGVSKGTGGAGGAFNQTAIYAAVGNSPPPWIGNNKGCNSAMAECGFWTAALTVSEIASLAKGTRCFLIREPSLVWYLPIDGLVSPEPDFSGNVKNATVTGTTSVFGPPITPLTPRWQFNLVVPAIPPGSFANDPALVMM